MSFNWSWKELAAFAIAAAAGVALVITHNATWRELATFAAGVLAFNRPMGNVPPSSTPKIGAP